MMMMMTWHSTRALTSSNAALRMLTMFWTKLYRSLTWRKGIADIRHDYHFVDGDHSWNNIIINGT